MVDSSMFEHLAMPFLTLADGHEADSRLWRFMGRLHPLMVHFPIGLAIAAAAVELANIVRRRTIASPFAFTATGFAAIAACLAAWFGWLNADYEGATADNTLFIHRWLGVIAAGGLVIVFLVGTVGRSGARPRALNGYRWGLVVCAVLVGVGSHFGGAMVYGHGYLTKVLFPAKTVVAAEDDASEDPAPPTSDTEEATPTVPATPVDDATVRTVSFEKDVLPILDARCVECHGPDKVKGSLRMDTAAELFSGDKEWWTVIPGDPDKSLLLERIELPADDPDAMPPKGDRLTTEETETIRRWIAEGAPHGGAASTVATAATASVPAGAPAKEDDPAPDAVAIEAEKAAAEAATRAAAIETAVTTLRDRKVVVGPISQSDSGFDVNASLVKPPFGDSDMASLDGLQPVLVWANFARSAITDGGVGSLVGFNRLVKLRLDNTGVGDGAVDALLQLPALETVNLYGSSLTDAGLARLASLPTLRTIYCAESQVTPEGVARAAREGLEIVGPVASATEAGGSQEEASSQ